MHSYQHSRGRILFEVACAFGMSASCAWAWQQTYATAMLPAAAIAALYGLVRAFDMRRPSASNDVEEPSVVTRSEPEPIATWEPEPVAVEPAAYVQPPMEDVLANVKRSRKSSKPAKAKKARAPEVVEQAVPEPLAVVDEAAMVEPEAPLLMEPEAPLDLDPPSAQVVQHPAQADLTEEEPEYAPPVVPLFEAEPFVRTQRRAAFGRKAG